MNNDIYFSLGLSYYEIMNLPKDELDMFLTFCSREEIIQWLQWNDPNGSYLDKLSISEFGEALTRHEATEIVMRQISE
jgi:hypothetical protein